MRQWLLLLLAMALANAQLSSPPIADVMQANAHLGPALENGYNRSIATSSTVPIPFYSNPVSVSGSVDIVGMSLMLDNATYPADGLAVLVARGTSQGHLWALPDPGSGDFICNYSSLYGPGGTLRQDIAWRCDFDHDSCAEYESSTQVVYAGTAAFTFRNSTYSAPFSSTVVAVPREALDAMKDSSGAEQLNVNIVGTIHFIYYINDRTGSSCADNYYYATRNLSFHTSRNFTVFGANKLYFLRAPVLREQWFRDNRFDTILLSQSPLYHAEILLNGNRTRDMPLRTFDVSTSPRGIEEITSSLASPDGWSEVVNLTTPVPLDAAGNSFSYIYAFNYSYEGLGQNALSLVVDDSFLGSSRYDEALTSRMLSYNGASTENGSPASSTPSRPSAAFSEDYMSSFELVLGLLALLFILSFVNVWLLK